MTHTVDTALWLSSCNTMMAELAPDNGIRILVLDLEHGVFDQAELNCFIPLCRAFGLQVYAKVLGPEAVAIQQALDFGASGVIIPHIETVEHARQVTAFAKYPPLGTRSFAAGRIVRYDSVPEDFYARENQAVRCFPMIESQNALVDVEAILALATVDGVFVGPTDLALSRGRPGYSFNTADQADIRCIADAAGTSGKPWIMPSWSAAERRFALEHHVDWMVVFNEQSIAAAGLQNGVAEVNRELSGVAEPLHTTAMHGVKP